MMRLHLAVLGQMQAMLNLEFGRLPPWVLPMPYQGLARVIRCLCVGLGGSSRFGNSTKLVC